MTLGRLIWPRRVTDRPIVLQFPSITPGATRPGHGESDSERPGLPRPGSENPGYVNGDTPRG